jgi:hypothetical protein
MAESDRYDNLKSRIGKNESIYPPHPDSLKNPHNFERQNVETLDRGIRRPAWRNASARKNLKEMVRADSQKPAGVIYIKERYFTMLKKDLILRNPLRVMGYENDDILKAGELGAVLARAGVGKTAFLVQLSLNALLRGMNVLHISLIDPVNKVSLWYKEVFNLIAAQYKVDQINQLWDSLLPHRFIMTFRVEGFSVPKLEERLADIMEQNIFTPQMIIVDGFPFDESVHQPLKDFKDLIQNHGMPAWFTVRTHRHEEPDSEGIPMQLAEISDLFEIAIQLLPVGKEIHVKALKGGESFAEQLDLQLDPSTMLIKGK